MVQARRPNQGSTSARLAGSNRQHGPLATPTDLPAAGVREITDAMNAALADVFALYLKTKNFHWHMSGPQFRDYHKLLDKHAAELLAMTDPIAERLRKIGGPTIRSIGHIASLQRIEDNDEDFVAPDAMLAELCEDNLRLGQHLREAHAVCDGHRDIATASLIESWIDQAEERTWYLFETTRSTQSTGP